jgi:biuret amidohydrolase
VHPLAVGDGLVARSWTRVRASKRQDQGVSIDPARSAVLALHWQVNVIKAKGFCGPMLSEPVARSGVVERAVRFHDSARRAGVPVVFTRFTVPAGEGELVRNTGFMRAVGDAQEASGPMLRARS